MQFEIQPIQAADMEAFLDFCSELSDFDGSAIFDREEKRAAAEPLLADPALGRAVWLLADGKRAGYLVLSFGWSFEFGGRTAVLEHLWVRPAFRRQGIGEAAIKWAETVCQAEGVGVVYLGVDTGNERAQNLYQKRGFEGSSLLFWMKML
jgi:ribosomal protein S18 acetylase RimI-like enzyme